MVERTGLFDYKNAYDLGVSGTILGLMRMEDSNCWA